MITYSLLYADVDPEEMKKSDSKDKYLHCHCRRETWLLDSAEDYLPDDYQQHLSSRFDYEISNGTMSFENLSLYKSLFNEK